MTVVWVIPFQLDMVYLISANMVAYYDLNKFQLSSLSTDDKSKSAFISLW